MRSGGNSIHSASFHAIETSACACWVLPPSAWARARSANASAHLSFLCLVWQIWSAVILAASSAPAAICALRDRDCRIYVLVAAFDLLQRILSFVECAVSNCGLQRRPEIWRIG